MSETVVIDNAFPCVGNPFLSSARPFPFMAMAARTRSGRSHGLYTPNGEYSIYGGMAVVYTFGMGVVYTFGKCSRVFGPRLNSLAMNSKINYQISTSVFEYL